MKLLLQIIRFIVIILLILDLFFALMLISSVHRVPLKTYTSVFGTAVILALVIILLSAFINFYFKEKKKIN